MFAIAIAAHLLFARIDVRGESSEGRVQEPTEPHALALAADADTVHAVIPVACAHQRQAVLAHCKAAIDRTRAMLVDRRGLRGDRWLRVALLLIGIEQGLFEEGNYFFEHRLIAS